MLNYGYIKLWRSILDWEWYDDLKTARLFIHLLLTANYEDCVWKNEVIKRGQRLTSVGKLSEETGLTNKEVRTALGKLNRTGETATKTTNKYTVITLENYEFFQGDSDDKGKQDGKQPGKQRASKGQTKGKQPGNNVRSKEVKNNIFVVDDDACANETQEILTAYLEDRDLMAERYFGYNAETSQRIKALTSDIFSKLAIRKPTPQDEYAVFKYVRESIHEEDGTKKGTWRIEFPKDRINLLLYAFEKASDAGCPANWNYISGVMDQLYLRGIRTLGDAENYDFEREQKKGRW